MMSSHDEEFVLSASHHIPANYLQHAIQASQHHRTQLNILLSQGKLPAEGWSETQIEELLAKLSQLDSNNFPHNVGVGEREARIYSQMVSRRHNAMGHGVGRSGDLCASQPKAAGSSLLYRLSCSLALDAIKTAGLGSAVAAVLLPCATGFSLLLGLAALAVDRPGSHVVVWTRCDQRSCLKAIHTAGLTPVVVEGSLQGDEVVTDVEAVRAAVRAEGRERVRAVVTTTSCFAPRACDDVEKIAVVCKEEGVPHIINNAYGVQSTKLMHRIAESVRVGRVDGVIQSTDKNFMVPVGGALLVTFDKTFAKRVGETYPGRASLSPATDLLITLLTLGSRGYPALTRQRNALKLRLDDALREIASRHHFVRVMNTPGNPISAALSLPAVPSASATALGAMLFRRCVSGARVVATGTRTTVGNTSLQGWGAHHSSYPSAYLTAAASIGMTETDVELFSKRLDRCLKDWWRKYGTGNPEGEAPVGLYPFCDSVDNKTAQEVEEGGNNRPSSQRSGNCKVKDNSALEAGELKSLADVSLATAEIAEDYFSAVCDEETSGEPAVDLDSKACTPETGNAGVRATLNDMARDFDNGIHIKDSL